MFYSDSRLLAPGSLSCCHVANTDFEFELAHPSAVPLAKAWGKHHFCLQLQYLPLLYGGPQDQVAVTAFPEKAFLESLEKLAWRKNEPLPTLVLLNEMDPFLNGECLSWGYSQQVAEWAKMRNMKYDIPVDWSVIQLVNNKAFSFKYTPFKEARLIWNRAELEDFLKSFEGIKVLKTCFGLSGQGNRLVDTPALSNELILFCDKEWAHGRPLVAEPWVDRIFDFSTQWFLDKAGRIDLLGSTVFATNAKGAYQGTVAGNENELFGEFLPYLEEHKRKVQEMLLDLSKMGFFGHVGVDALLYRFTEKKNICLYPIVEINARKTMSWVALRMQQKWFKDQTISLNLTNQTQDGISLLPRHIPGVKPFKRNLSLLIL